MAEGVSKAKEVQKSVTLPPVVPDEKLKEAIIRKNYPKEVEEDLLERFEERLIINKSQITPRSSIQGLEAGGFDYQGKSPLRNKPPRRKEPSSSSSWGRGTHGLGAGADLHTQKGSTFKVAILPQMETRVIPLSKIFLLRQIKMLFL